MSFTDTSGVQPYQEYSYQLRACTVVGCADSSKVSKLVFTELVNWCQNFISQCGNIKMLFERCNLQK